MGRLKENDHDEEPATIPIASTRDLENFKAERIAPTESYFRLDVEGTRMSPWNKVLATVFTRCFVGSAWYQGESLELIKNAFSVHSQTLIKNWKAQQRRSDIDVQDDDDLQKELNSDQRRRSVRTPIRPDPLFISSGTFSSGSGGIKQRRLAVNFRVSPRFSKMLAWEWLVLMRLTGTCRETLSSGCTGGRQRRHSSFGI